MGRWQFAAARSHDFARHRHAEALADGEGGGACRVKAMDPRGWFGGVFGKGEVRRVEGAEGCGKKVDEPEDEGDPLGVHDLEV